MTLDFLKKNYGGFKMKNSKWMRFLLIALSAVMVLSLFACGGGNTEEETTVDNGTNEETTVEDTTVEDTTVDDTTVEDTTVEDTTVEDTTVEDTTVEDTTVEDTTVEDTTVEDTTVEDTTVEDTTVEDTTESVEVNVECTPDKLVESANANKNNVDVVLSEDGSYAIVTIPANAADPYFYAFTGNTAASGRYAIIKYRTTANINTFFIYTSTKTATAASEDDRVNAYVVADGEWHIMLVDLAGAKNVVADDNGEYAVQFLRLNPFGGAAKTGEETVDIAYVGVHDSIADLDVVADSSSMLELGNNFSFSVDGAIAGDVAFNGGINANSFNKDLTVSRDNANIAITGGWLVVADTSFANMGLYYKIVDANGNATKLTKAGMNITAAEEDVWNACAGNFPGATPMRVDGSKGGLIIPDLKGYSGQTVTVYIYAISDDVWAEHGVIAGRVVLTLTVTVEKSEKAQIGDVVYEDIEEAFAALKDGDTIKLLKDVTLPTAVVIDKNITVNLNGKTISIPEDTDGSGVFHVVEGGVLTINGNGTVNGVGKNDWNMALWVEGGKAIINGGTFTNVGATDSNGGDQFDLIYVKGGELVINGGTFKAENPQWTINCNDSKPGTVSIYGGTFNGFDPSNTKTEPAGKDNNFLADGYVAVASGANYVVYREVSIPEAIKIANGLSSGGKTTDKYYVTGTVMSIENTTYGNMTIKDENGNKIIVWGLYSADGSTRYDAMATKPKIGDTIKVLSVILNFNGNKPELENAWLVGHEVHICSDWTEATCKAPKTCTYCGATEGNLLPHNYVNGNCSECGAKEPQATVPGQVLINGTFNKAVPSQLKYITNNSSYPNPSWYSDGGLKMNYVKMGIQTVKFDAQSSVVVTLNIKALNQNQKSDNKNVDAFTFYGLNEAGQVVATATLQTVKKGDNTVTLNGDGIVSVKVIMTDFPFDGSKACNVSAGGLKVVSN